MNCASAKTKSRGGVTFVELLVALTIASAFMSGVYLVFSQVLQAHRDAEVRLEALRNGRTALTSLTDEIKDIRGIETGQQFALLGLDFTLGYGDGIDNDFDGELDEEAFDGVNDDLPTGVAPTAPANRHAVLASGVANRFERPMRLATFDLGDADVDEDVRFGRDVLVFRTFPSSPTENFVTKTVTYTVADFDGRPNVLIRQARIQRTNGQEDLIGLAPIAFNVLGFDVLYWNPNADAANMYYVTAWDSTNPPRGPGFESPDLDSAILQLPASIYVRITLQADPRPETLLTPGGAVKTIILNSMINIEEVIDSVEYESRRPRF